MSKRGTSSCTSYPPIAEKPHQPVNFDFSRREYGKQVVVKCTFQAIWFAKWMWLHYQESDDYIFIHTCVKAFKELKMHSSSAEDAFVSEGFHNWKIANSVFHQHILITCRKEAVEWAITLPTITTGITEALSMAYAWEKLETCQCFLKILLTNQEMSTETQWCSRA